MSKKIFMVLLLVFLFTICATKVDASFTISSNSIIGTGSSTIDLGSSHDLYIQTSGGKVGVGTSNPQYTLHVVGNIYASGNVTCGGSCGGGGGGSGTVTSVGNGTIGSLFVGSWATATTTPALSLDFATQSGNKFLASPSNGSSGSIIARTIVAGDIPILNQDTTGKSAKTDALNSATTVINVSSATAPTNGQVLTATGGTAATWQTPSGGGSSQWTTSSGNIYFNTGNVGIGITNPTDPLMVVGNASISGTLNTNGWSVAPAGQVFYFEGSSLTRGNGLGTAQLAGGGLTGNYGDLLSKSIWGLGKGTYYNDGINGHTSADDLAQYYTGNSTYGVTVPSPHSVSPSVTSSTTRHIYFLDLTEVYNDAGSAIDTATSISNLTSLTTLARSEGWFVVLITNPINNINSTAYLNQINAVNQAARDGTIPSDMVADASVWIPNQTDTKYYIDGLHPNANGHKVIAANLLAGMISGGFPVHYSGGYYDYPFTLNNGLTVATPNTDTSSYVGQFSSGGNSRLAIRADGNIGMGITNPTAALDIVKDSGAGANWAVYGQLLIQGASNPNQRIIMGYDTTNDYGWIQPSIMGTAYENLVLTPGNGSNVGIGQTAPSQRLEVNGGLRLNTVIAKPTCDSTVRGTFWFTENGNGVKDNVEVCAKDAGNAYAWRTIY